MLIDSGSLRSLCGKYQYPIQNEQFILFAVRGSLPEATLHGDFQLATAFKSRQVLKPVRVNYETSRCTIGVWDTRANIIALFPGSTLPSVKYLFSHPASLETFNILCPGSYRLRRGIHPRNEDGLQRHEALLMDEYALVKIPQVIQSKKRLRFDFGKSQYNVWLAGDNLHAARTEPADLSADVDTLCQESLQLPYSSSGCITIIGQPEPYVKRKPGNGAWNCWQTFMLQLNKTVPDQINFSFILFTFADLLDKSQNSVGKFIRYGSKGAIVTQIQQFLQSVINLRTGLPYFTGEVTGHFSGQTAFSYLQFQEDFTNGKAASEIDFQHFFSKTKHFTSYLKQPDNVSH